MVRSYGYPAEDHSVVTEDGYILGVHRIPHGANNEKVIKNNAHVFPDTYVIIFSIRNSLFPATAPPS